MPEALYIATRNLNTARTATETKHNLFHLIFLIYIFVNFFKLLNISLDVHSLCLSYVK